MHPLDPITMVAPRQAAIDFTPKTIGDPAIRAFAGRTELVLDREIDAAYPARWIGLIEVEAADGNLFRSRVDTPIFAILNSPGFQARRR